jgi:ABC-type branched-subunit amino acid transport system ATPase component/MFS family permease
VTVVDRLKALVAGDDAPSLREVVGSSPAGWYPLGVVTALNFVDELDRAAMAVFAPDIRRAFDLSNSALGGIVGLQVTLVIILGIPIGYLGTRVDRARLLQVSAAAWGVFAAATGFMRAIGLFVVARLGAGIGKASVEPVGRSLLSDQYPPAAWNRVFAFHSAANPAGNIAGPLLAGLIGLLVAGDGAWRWAFPLLSIPTAVALFFALRLREPDMTRATADRSTELPLGQAVSRMMRIPTFYRQLVGIGVFGFALVGVVTFSSVLYDEVFHVGEGGRGAIIAFLATASLAGNIVGARIGERVFNASPRRAVLLVSAAIAAFCVLLTIAVLMPHIALCVAVQWVALAVVGGGATPLVPVISAISPPKLRPLAFSMLGLYVALFGGVVGGVVIGALADAWGIRGGMAALGPIGVAGALLMARAAATVEDDIATAEREAADVVSPGSGGDAGLALRVRGLDFSYGKLQVLFDVDLDVREGEVVALLGTNGAGKSTLLRAVTGLDLPDRGTVRAFGEDVTWLDAEARVKKGLIQVPGGRGTFPSLSVLENLRTGAYTFRKDRARVERSIEEVFGYFPVLEQRKDQPAGTMSGGEQQMLALGRAFVASPRLLMIDELSLGLAPVIVEQLLGIVRAFSDRGTTLVLVEQSVNLALSLATTAYFMERGQVRFGGPSAELLERSDLLRSVFLEGAEKGLAPVTPGVTA